ncbi:tape measure protein [Pseudomonas sp. JI-2]|nr:tape measure protein [Pseudomonas sp. JI-2]
MIVSKYTISVGFNFPKSEIRKVDFQLKALEKRFQAFGKNMAASFAKTLTLPELKVKKLSLDSLGAQRTLQTDLNRIGRLLQVPIGNVQLDQARINKQLQGVVTRAASAARINIRTIQGSSGGANPHYPSHLGVPRGFDAFSGGLGGASAAGFLPRLGPIGGAVAGVAAGAAYGVSKINDARKETATRESQRLQLETAVGGSRERRESFTKGFFDLSNDLGISAESQITAYSRFMKQAQSSGMTAQEGFDLFKNVATATRGNGGDQQSIERQAYALQQMLGVGYLRGEELNQQLSDSNPSIKAFIMRAYAERTGKTGTEAFLDALSNREVSVQDVLKGYEKSAKEASDRVRELSGSIQGAEARLENLKLAEELQRTVDGPMTEAAKQWTEAQTELHGAMEPLRDSFYSVAASATSLAASLISWGVKQSESAPAVNGEASNEQRSENPWSSSTGRGMLSIPDARAIKQPSYPQFVSPLIPEQKQWEKSRFIPSVESLMPSTSSKVVNNNPVINQTFNVNGVDSFEFKSLFQNEFRNVIETTMLQYSEKE